MKILPLTLVMALSGCSYVGVAATDDPVKLLQQAQEMWQMERYIPAEKLALSSLEHAKESGDTLAQANAYRYLGNFYKSPLYRQHADWFEDEGRYDPTYQLAITQFENAAALWEQRGDQWGVAAEYFNLGTVASLRGEREIACERYTEALRLYETAIFTGVVHTWNANFTDFPSMVEAFAEEEGCD